MKEERIKDFVFVLYIIVALILAIVYFSVSERAGFLSNTIDWWAGFLDIMR